MNEIEALDRLLVRKPIAFRIKVQRKFVRQLSRNYRMLRAQLGPLGRVSLVADEAFDALLDARADLRRLIGERDAQQSRERR